jgi:Glycosyltransferase sugar-binding region containing DXD motif
MERKKLVSFWDGKVTWLERLSVATILDMGHSLEIFTNNPSQLQKEVDCKVTDVQEVMCENDLATFYRQKGNFAFYADLVRLELLIKGRGIWTDLDCLFLKPLNLESQYIFGLCDSRRINNAVLFMPQNSQVLNSYYTAVRKVPILAPWATRHIRWKRYLEIAVGKTMPINPNKLSIGPRALTYFINQSGLTACAQPESVFYPIRQSDCRILLGSDDRAAKARILDDTISIHAWRSNWMSPELIVPIPSHGSVIGQLAKRYSISS